jgi:hypothetical protein
MSQSLNLRARVRQYLRERRRLGFQLRSMGHALRSFALNVDKLVGADRKLTHLAG